MRFVAFGIVFVVAVAAAGFYFFGSAPPAAKKAAVRIGNREFAAEVADTPLRRAKGLSGRAMLPENEGMLFVFEREGSHGFWMKDMRFPIDIVWIRGDRIVGFAEGVAPQPERSVFNLDIHYPPEPVDKVLEVAAGAVGRCGFRVGDLVTVAVQ